MNSSQLPTGPEAPPASTAGQPQPPTGPPRPPFLTTAAPPVAAAPANHANILQHHRSPGTSPVYGGNPTAGMLPPVRATSPMPVVSENVQLQQRLPLNFNEMFGVGQSTITTGTGAAPVAVTGAAAPQLHGLPDIATDLPHKFQQFNHEDFQDTEGGPKARELKVEDALLYLDQVKQQFGEQPRIYNQFLNVMKNFKSQQIDTPGVINRVSTLFKGYPRLILGFNTFLPPGFKIRADATYEVAGHAGGSFPIDNNTAPWVKPPSSSARSAPTSPKAASKSKTSPRGGSSSAGNNHRGQPVEFDHAITYVTTIKKRFSQEPDTYKSFLEILHTYQKEQRSIKQVLEQVSHLFRDHPDLLREFTYFLPDAAQEQAKVTLNMEADKSVERKRLQKKKKDSEKNKEKQLKERALKDIERFRGRMKGDKDRDRQKLKYQDKRSKKRTYDEKERRDRFAYEEANVLPAEWHFFERARKVLPTRDAWREFLKCLDLYSQEVLGQTEMLSLASNLFGRHTDIIDDFKTLLDQHGARDTHNDVWFSMPLAEIDFSRCRRCTPSYRALPASYPNPACSVRSELERSVCNDSWVSVPTGSEDFSFKNMRKNQYEEALFKCEDERFEIDMLIDANACTIRILEPLAAELNSLRDKENANELQWDYRIDRRTFGTIHLNAISRVYGENGNDVLELLRKHPAGAIPVILERLKQKDAEWLRARQDLNNQWKEVNEKNFHKSLDHCSFYFKQQDKKNVSSKGLLVEAKEQLRKSTATSTTSMAVEGGKTPTPAVPQWKPTFTLDFSQPHIHRMAYAVMNYAAEHNISSGDNEKLAKLWKEYLLHFLNLPEDWLTTKPVMRKASDCAADALKAGVEVTTPYGSGTIVSFSAAQKIYVVSLSYGEAHLQPSSVEVEEKDKFPPNLCVSDDPKYVPRAEEEQDRLASEHVRLMYEGQSAYTFFRLYHMLYQRLLEAQRLCEKAKRNRRKVTYNPAARALSHTHHTDEKDVEKAVLAGDFEAYISTLYALLDGTIDNSRYEDACRNLIGSSSYVLSTMDKLVSQMLKQLQTMANDDTSAELQKIYLQENESSERIVPSEYFNKTKTLFESEDAFRFQFHSGVLRQTPLTVPLAKAPDSDQSSKIWAPSPRFHQVEPCPWLVKPTLSIEYLGEMGEEMDEGEEEEEEEETQDNEEMEQPVSKKAKREEESHSAEMDVE